VSPHPISRAQLNSDQLERFEERAAIMEYDGGLTRKEAESRALLAVDPAPQETLFGGRDEL